MFNVAGPWNSCTYYDLPFVQTTKLKLKFGKLVKPKGIQKISHRAHDIFLDNNYGRQ